MREVVVSYAEGTNKTQLFRMFEDGSSRTAITDGTHHCAMASCSPDGTKIVHVRMGDFNNELWVCDIDGANAHMILDAGTFSAPVSLFKPVWHPDSKYIVWYDVGSGKPKSKLYIMNTETMQFRYLFSDPTQIKASNMMASISPDGSKVVFVSDRDTSHYRIWTSNLDGSGAKKISTMTAPLAVMPNPRTVFPKEQKVPCWSPDGLSIAHWEGVEQSYLNGNPAHDQFIATTWNVWTVGADGVDKVKIGHGDDPNWSPDGYVTRTYSPSPGVVTVMAQTASGEQELPIVPPNVANYGGFAWNMGGFVGTFAPAKVQA